MPDKNITFIRSVSLDGKNYPLVHTEEFKQAWKEVWQDEPPWEEGLGNMVSAPQRTWHMGAFKSFEGVPGTTEKGDGTDCRWPGRIIPGPLQQEFASESYDSPVVFFEALGYLFGVCGRYIMRVGPATGNTMVLSKDLGEGVLGIDGLRWETADAFVTTDEDTNSLWKLTAISEEADESTFDLAADEDDCYLRKYGSVYADTRASGATLITGALLNVGQYYVGGSYGILRPCLRFNSAAIPDENTVLTGKLKLYLKGNSSDTGFIIQVRALTWGGGTPAWSGAPSGDTLIGTFATSSLPVVNSYVEIDIDPSAIVKDGYTELYLVSSRDDDNPGTEPLGNEYVIFEAREHVDDHPAQLIVTHQAAGGGPDTWAQTTSVKSYLIAAGLDRFYKVTKDGELANLSTGLDPVEDEDFYADRIQMGSTVDLPTAIAAFGKTVLVGKPEGLYGVSPEGYGELLLKRGMAHHADNCKGLAVGEPYVYIPHRRGLFRFTPGYAEAAGLETEVLNESEIQGTLAALAFDGAWVYAILRPYQGATGYILVGRDRKEGEIGFGPVVWDIAHSVTITDLDRTLTLWVSHLWSPPRLFYGLPGDATFHYVQLSPGGGPPLVSEGYQFATSGSRTTPRLRFNDWEDKNFPKVKMSGRNVGSPPTRYWAVYYSVDGAAFSPSDIDGSAMVVTSDGLHTFYLPVAAVGKEIQFRLDFAGASDNPPELNYFEPFAVHQSKKVPIITAYLHLAAGAKHDMAEEGRDAITQLNNLVTLSESAQSVATYGPWGRDIQVIMRRVHLVGVLQEGGAAPEFLVEVTLLRRE